MAEKNTLIKEAKDEVEFISAEEEERRIQRFYDNGFFEVRLAYSEGIDAGIAEGIAKGRAEGRVEGRAEGRAEGKIEGKVEGRAEGIAEGIAEGEISGRLNAFIEIAKQMLVKKYTINEIKSLTGLSEKEIQKLAENV